MAIAVAIVARGVSKGIERASMILMPTLIALIVVLAIYSLVRGGFWPTWNYLFAFDLSTITPKIALEALGLGFFSIGVGLSIMIAYAAYAERDINLRQVAMVTLVSDTAVSFLAAFAIFPIVFAENLDPSSGPGLVFITLPLAFSHMPFGTAASIAFFTLLAGGGYRLRDFVSGAGDGAASACAQMLADDREHRSAERSAGRSGL